MKEFNAEGFRFETSSALNTVMQPALLTTMTSPRLLFEYTAHFLQSEIQSVFRSFRKSAVTNPSGTDLDRAATPQGWNTGMYFINPDRYAIISSRGEKCGLAGGPVMVFP